MIEKVVIKNPEDTKFNRTKRIKALSSGKEFIFKPGLNLIVGENGCGKSTLVSLIKYYFLETESYKPEINTEEFEHLSLLKNDGFYEGVEVYADWDAPTFSMTDYISSKRLTLNSLSMKLNRGSSGENNMMMFNHFIENSYRDAEENKWISPVDVLSNVFRTDKRLEQAADYYNRCKIDSKGLCLIMDEPDNNLSINNILKFKKAMNNIMDSWTKIDTKVQYIMVLHNPILLKYFYTERDDTNFIEMSKGFLDCLKKI